MNNKKHIINLEYFGEMLHICSRIPNQTFDELSFEEEFFAFLIYLGHSGEIKKITDVNINKLHQPWRSFAAVINKCLSGKSTVEHKDAKKSNEMYYPRFTKVIINFFMTKDPLILRRNKGINCLPKEEIFAELSRMGYEKPSTMLTFYKVFFSPQWKFLFHTILQCMSAKRTSWNEFSSSMAFYRAQVGDLSSHYTKYSSPALTQKVFANIRRVGKGFLGVDTPLFEGMIVAQQVDEVNVDDVPAAGVADEGAANVNVDDVLNAADEPIKSSLTPTTPPPPPLQDVPSTLQVQPTPPPSLIDQPPSP
uniref:Synaptobrevin, longin-like domain protein n=1 Tax=Tanacetum cinerariifolium TaxID=118510 RepID=A0A6L2KHX4_TANCI|nr:hypothetical protein [Tanacetum cinerariifolium]